MYRGRLSSKWTREIYHKEDTNNKGNNCTLTFCGVYEDYYDEIAKNWDKHSDKEKTRQQYNRDYDKKILPSLENHNNKRIQDYTKEDCDKAIEKIIEEGYTENGVKKEYAPSTINHFMHLIYIVFKAAFNNNLCDDILWGTKYEISDNTDEAEKVKGTRIPKSLPPNIEKRLVEVVMQSPDESGDLVGLLIMLAIFVRDGEACGLSFGDVYESKKYKGCYIALIKQSTIPQTRILQSSGKTKNSVRRISIPDLVYMFIQERKQIIMKIIEERNLDLDINRIPVAGKDSIYDENADLTKRLKADELSKKAREVFKEIGLDSRILSVAEIEMEEGIKNEEVKEKSATAYLLRRNGATHLKKLGLNDADIQYLIGHHIDDSTVSRPDYIDGRIYELSQKMKYRPLLNTIDENELIIDETSEMDLFGKEIISFDSKSDSLRIRIEAEEKEDELTIKFNKEEGQSVDIREGYKRFDPKETVNVLRQYIDLYK